MRRWLIAGGVVAVLLGGALAVAVVNLGRWVGMHREWVASEVEAELGRRLEFGEAVVSLRGGLGVRITDVRIPDDPGYGGGDLLRASEAWVMVRLLPAFFGWYEIRRIVLDSPVLTAIRDARGMNLETLGSRRRSERARGGSGPRATPRTSPLFVVGLFELRNGEVRYIDRRRAPPRELAVRRLDVTASDVAVGRPIVVEARAALPGAEEPNLVVRGTVGPLDDPDMLERVPLKATLRLGEFAVDVAGSVRRGNPKSVDLTLDADRAALAGLVAVAPTVATDVGGTLDAHLSVRGGLRAEPLPAVTGTVALAAVRARRPGDAVGIADLGTTITVADGVARMPATRFRIGDAPVEAEGTFAMAERLLTIDRVAAQAFGGSLEGRARADLRTSGRPRFAVEGTARGVSLQPLLAARGSRLATHAEGRLDAAVSLTGAGRRGRVLRRSLAGTARIDVHDGVLRGVNLVEEVLASATGVERIATLVPARLRKQRPDLFGVAQTRFEELRATARIAAGSARTDDLLMRTDSYTVRGRGSTDVDGTVDLTATFLAGRALTADVLASVKDARCVTNDEQLIEVPFRVAGRFPDVHLRPDPAFVARSVGRALAARAREALGTEQHGEGGLVEDALRGLERLFGR